MKEADIKKLGKYDILGELGKGAMGVVYKGKDPFIEREVAIKTVRIDMLAADDPEATTAQITRFKREAQAAGRINHPNIVAIYEYGEDGPTAFIAMEFIDGHDLKEVFDKNERFELKDIVRIMSDVLGALDFAHKRGIVHRDIKPANIMMTRSGEVKITDFGIARIESSNLTQAGAVLGTPSYMSPEQFMGQQVDARSDLFSAGAMLYQFLTSEKPFVGSLTTIMHKILNSQPEPPSLLNVQVPKGFDQVVLKAMAKRPEDRYQSAAEFAQAVRDAFEGKLAAPPPPVRAEADDEATMAGERTMFDPSLLSGGESVKAAPPPPPPPQQPVRQPLVVESPVRIGNDAAPARPKPAPLVPAPLVDEEKSGGGKGLIIGIAAAVIAVVAGGGAWMVMGPKPTPTPAPGQQQVQQSQSTPQDDQDRRERERQAREQQAKADAEAEVAVATAAAVRARAEAEAEAAAVAAAAAVKARAEAEAAAAVAAAKAEADSVAAAAAAAAAKAKADAEAAATAALGSLRTSLARVECSLLQVDLGGNGDVLVNGSSGNRDIDTEVRRLVGAALPGRQVALKVDPVTKPMCDPLAVVAKARAANQGAAKSVAVRSATAEAVYRNTQHLIVDIEGPQPGQYLQVDYFTLEGAVVHLLPNPKETDARQSEAGNKRRLGDPAAGGRFWNIGPPFGRELIVVTASRKPLFATPRPEAEATAAYLAELRKALDAAEKSGAVPVSSALFIKTVPN
ncbi:eukaryotic-like serine/threonine-protein kinase [uncultured Gammaproteobacteria bacterium]